MDAISDNVFTELDDFDVTVDDPSLLTVILDLSPQGWFNIRNQITLQEVTKQLLVFLNAHLSLNNANKVAIVASSSQGSKFLYPIAKGEDESAVSQNLINKEMYRQFRLVDQSVLHELNKYYEELCQNFQDNPQASYTSSTLSGALLLVLTYTNRMLSYDPSITTTTASAMNSTANSTARGDNITGTTSLSLKSRILIMTANDDDNINYIPVMNAIFAAQKMKVPIDVAKFGKKDNVYLQQASDTSHGVYLRIDNPQGLIQVLTTAFFIEPSIRPLIILPTISNTNYKASCFITGKLVDVGYVCSVCLCIMSIIPESQTCPTCASKFDPEIIEQLQRSPVVIRKKKKE